MVVAERNGTISEQGSGTVVELGIDINRLVLHVGSCHSALSVEEEMSFRETKLGCRLIDPTNSHVSLCFPRQTGSNEVCDHGFSLTAPGIQGLICPCRTRAFASSKSIFNLQNHKMSQILGPPLFTCEDLSLMLLKCVEI